MHVICTANTSAAILQHGIYCSSTAVWQRPIADPLAIYSYFEHICGLHFHNPHRGVKVLASIAFSLSLAAVLVCLCTTAAMQHLLQHFLRDLSLCLCA